MKKRTTRIGGILSGVSFGVVCGASLTMLLSLLLALLINYEKIMWDNVGFGIMFIFYISAFCSTSIALRKVKRQKTMVCIISALIYQLFLMIVTLLFWGGRYYAVIPTMLTIAAGAGTSRLLAPAKIERKTYRYTKI